MLTKISLSSPRLLALAAAISLGAGFFSHAAETPTSWPRFRGPNGAGVAPGSGTSFALEKPAWKTPVQKGLSSPITAGGKVFLTALDDARLVTVAFDAVTGTELWRRQAPPVPIERVHAVNSPATPSPCTDGVRVFVYFGSFGVICYDLGGKEIWSKSLPTPKSLYGMAASPILSGDLLVLVLDDDANLPDSTLSRSRLLALNKENGEMVWETSRPLVRSGWATPAIWREGQSEDLVVLGSGRLAGYDPKTGTEKWFVTGFARETIAVPVFGSGMAFACSAMGGMADEKPDPEPLWNAMLYFDADADGKIAQSEMTEHFTFPFRPEVRPSHPGFGMPLSSDPTKRREQQRGIFNGIDKDRDGFWTREEFATNLGPRPFRPRLMAVRPGGSGNITETHVAWELNRGIPEIPTPLFWKDRLYLVRNGGVLASVNATTGKMIYEERLGAGGQYSASPVLAGERLYLLSNKGVISVVAAGDRFQLETQQDLGEPAFVTPAIAGDTLFIRTEAHLTAFRAR